MAKLEYTVSFDYELEGKISEGANADLVAKITTFFDRLREEYGVKNFKLKIEERDNHE